MADVAHAAPSRTRSGLLRRERRAEPSVTFPEVVHLHRLWREALHENAPGLPALDERYRAALAAFEAEHGRIVNAYWCYEEESAVALTVHPRWRLLRRSASTAVAFHRVSDWATRNQADIALQLHRCDELAVRADRVLTGLRRRICLQLVMAAAGHLLSLVDARAKHEDEAETQRALAELEEELDRAERYYESAANGQAQMVYVGGMGAVAGVLAFVAAGTLLGIEDRGRLFAAILAGALGALVSVVQRIHSGEFRLEYDVGRPYLLFLGGLRPVLGAGFGLITYAALTSGLITVGQIDPRDSYVVVVLAFAAGFTERLATDALLEGAVERTTPPADAPAAGDDARPRSAGSDRPSRTAPGGAEPAGETSPAHPGTPPA
jgi:hypothetical protein